MSLSDLNDRFFAGDLDKAAFVAAMQVIHRQLLDYASYLPRTDIARIEIADGKVLLTCASSGLKLQYDDPLDQYGCLALLNFGNYETPDTQTLLRLAQAQALAGSGPFTFLDIGANMGWYTLTLALRFPAATVHAFEPLPGTFRGLALNLAANNLANVQLHNLGFLETDGNATFFLDPRISGRASARNLVDDPEALPVTCPVTRLDDFVRARGIVPDLIKIDVEGSELMVIKGGLETIAAHRPLIMSEMLRKWALKFGYHPNEMIDLLAGLGYRCFIGNGNQLAEQPRMTDEVTATNFFFLHREKHAALI